jgi:hypothetical protein
MTILCLEDFKIQFEKLKKKNSYLSIEKDIIDYFFEKEVNELLAATLWCGKNCYLCQPTNQGLSQKFFTHS